VNQSGDNMKIETLTDLNWEIAMESLDDAIKHLRECRERLEKALEDLRRERMMDNTFYTRTYSSCGNWYYSKRVFPY